jgi:RNA polymerase-binding transcription factor DksA
VAGPKIVDLSPEGSILAKQDHAQWGANGSGKGMNGNGNGRSGNGSNGRHSAAGNGEIAGGQLPKSPLTLEDLDRFRQLLVAKRRELLGDVTHMEDEALRRTRSDAAGDLSMMPIHMADIGTDNYEQEFTIGLIAGERDVLKEIDSALQRITEGTYGICLATHKPISRARLNIKPWASYCVEYERANEENGRR